ncbi:hypothetical protein SKAU_G00145330 [Synaphobranchus kaupii]|uniref:Uncharacterized protein n=1 Tax=Synaphobranchus kaupii TaxID=118154 RepID=A0A9Q1J2J1_SYNKA|nr:hypothetical protein SKAU_G00145330 [Synaphobranchus kaupii]
MSEGEKKGVGNEAVTRAQAHPLADRHTCSAASKLAEAPVGTGVQPSRAPLALPWPLLPFVMSSASSPLSLSSEFYFLARHAESTSSKRPSAGERGKREPGRSRAEAEANQPPPPPSAYLSAAQKKRGGLGREDSAAHEEQRVSVTHTALCRLPGSPARQEMSDIPPAGAPFPFVSGPGRKWK